jgi:Flp pilus assembly pilin Flp
VKVKQERGAALIEYAMLVGLISVVSIGAVLHLGEEVQDVFSTTTSGLADASQTASDSSQDADTQPDFSLPEEAPTGAAAATFTFTAGIKDDNTMVGYSSYYAGFGSMDDYAGAYPSIQQLTYYDHDVYPGFTFRVSGNFVDEFPGHTLSCSDGLSLAFDDGFNLSYESSGDRTSITWHPGENPDEFLREGVQIDCRISDS